MTKKKSAKKTPAKMGERLLLRCTQAGVIFGTVSGYEEVGGVVYVALSESRKIHYWNGAAACDELATHGINPHKTGSRVCVLVRGRRVRADDVAEAYPITSKAWANLSGHPEWRA